MPGHAAEHRISCRHRAQLRTAKETERVKVNVDLIVLLFGPRLSCYVWAPGRASPRFRYFGHVSSASRRSTARGRRTRGRRRTAPSRADFPEGLTLEDCVVNDRASSTPGRRVIVAGAESGISATAGPSRSSSTSAPNKSRHQST